VTPQDTPETLEAKVHAVEYDIYPRAILQVLNDCSGVD
jgi:folate-dependent phosphoribosylglycinamide formyltransferase PurN